MKLDLLTNAIVVDDAIRFVASEKSKDKEAQVKSLPSLSDSDNKDDEKSDKNRSRKTARTGNREITIDQVF
jgi:hypothetical protein